MPGMLMANYEINNDWGFRIFLFGALSSVFRDNVATVSFDEFFWSRRFFYLRISPVGGHGAGFFHFCFPSFFGHWARQVSYYL
jgi:hypothetical protein